MSSLYVFSPNISRMTRWDVYVARIGDRTEMEVVSWNTYMRGWKNNIKTDIKKLRCENVE
jgi:hypothetical protein